LGAGAIFDSWVKLTEAIESTNPQQTAVITKHRRTVIELAFPARVPKKLKPPVRLSKPVDSRYDHRPLEKTIASAT
jgi:hypothetical protein